MSTLIRLLASVALCALAAHDIRHRRLPTRLVAVVGALYFVDALIAGDSLHLILSHGAVALAVFAIGFVLFALRWIGGGDVKLAAAIFVWTGTALAWPVLLLISVAGLPLAACSLVATRLTRRRERANAAAFAASAAVGTAAATDRQPLRPRSAGDKLAYWLSAKRGVPYGVALALGGTAGLWLPVIFRLPRF
ncbi:prepilin peptidase [Paraburkholderia sp. PREW-6R]|uniref:A24 family peptidase n=1 Tax=Paraburkholderia sp. PREW-6R TaxID=3141544 RepID=UPI0031F4B706